MLPGQVTPSLRGHAVLFFLDADIVAELRDGPTGILLAINGLVFVLGAVLFGRPGVGALDGGSDQANTR